MCTEKCRHAIAPRSFFCMSLKVGSLIVGLVISVVLVIVIICTSVQVYETSKTVETSSTFTERNNYSFAVVAVLYSLFMLALCLWFVWGVIKEKATVVISWLVISTLWLAQTFCLVLVLIYLHSVDTNFIGWILALLFGIAAIGVLAYGLLVVFGFWLQLKEKKQAPAVTS